MYHRCHLFHSIGLAKSRCTDLLWSPNSLLHFRSHSRPLPSQTSFWQPFPQSSYSAFLNCAYQSTPSTATACSSLNVAPSRCCQQQMATHSSFYPSPPSAPQRYRRCPPCCHLHLLSRFHLFLVLSPLTDTCAPVFVDVRSHPQNY